MSDFIYLDIAADIRSRIGRGEFGEGRLPSERILTGEFGVQRATIRRALKKLEREGIVFRDATRGTYAGSLPVQASSRAISQGGIALVVGRADDTTAPGDVARGISTGMREENRFVIWFDRPAASGHAEALAPEPYELIDRGVAAMALWPQIPANLEALRAVRNAVALVLLDRRVPGFESDFVGIDDFLAARDVTQHLLGLGHRRIGFLAVTPQVSTVQARSRGWMTALAEAGIPAPAEWAFHRNGESLHLPGDARAIDLFLSNGEAPLSAVVCSNDTVAAVLIQHLRRTGRKVPDDVAVTGFGNSFPHLLDALGLTTVAQPWEAIGQAAGGILRGRLRGEVSWASFQEVELPGTLIIRGSCGASVDL